MIDESWVVYHHKLSVILNQLRKAREDSNTTQSSIADEMGCSQGVVSSIERMEFNVRLFTLMKYADALGYDLTITVEPRLTPQQTLNQSLVEQ
jgi:transcriptional regulator with XRE-family HTH domain